MSAIDSKALLQRLLPGAVLLGVLAGCGATASTEPGLRIVAPKPDAIVAAAVLTISVELVNAPADTQVQYSLDGREIAVWGSLRSNSRVWKKAGTQ